PPQPAAGARPAAPAPADTAAAAATAPAAAPTAAVTRGKPIADWPAVGVAAAMTLVYAGVWAAAQAAPTPLAPAPIALGVMAGIGALALGASLRLGPWFVLLGLALAFAAPALVALARPAPAALFAYLAAITGAALLIVRVRDWRLLPWFALAGALLWPTLWLAFAFTGAAQVAVSVYLVAVAAMCVAFGWRDTKRSALTAPSEAGATASAGVIGAGLLLLGLTHVTGHGVAPATGVFALAAAVIAAAAFREGLVFAALGAAIIALATLIDWPALPPIAGGLPHIVLGVNGLVSAGAALAFAASVGGWAMMARHERPVIGAGLSALGPPLVLAALHWKSDGFGPGWAWGLMALTLAAVTAWTLVQMLRRAGRADDAVGPINAFAVGAAISAACAVGFALSGYPLGAGLALLAPACAWFDRQYALPALKASAAIAAAAAVIWLVPPLALLHPVGATPLLNALAPSYIVAATALALAARLFDQTVGRDDTLLVQTLEAAALLLAAVFLSAEVRHLANAGAMTAPYATLAEVGGHTLAWLGFAIALAWRFGPQPRRLLFVAEALAFCAALANVAIMGLVVVNPWWGLNPAPAPGWPIANALALAFAAPAAALALYAALRSSQGMTGRAGAAAAAAVVLAFVNVTLEVRRAAHGPLDLQTPPVGIGEGWTMLAAWGLVVAALAGVGVWRRSPLILILSLGGAALTIGKGALVDAPALDGLSRAIAFFALAAAALLAAFFYLRVLGPRPAAAPVYRAAAGDPNLSPPQDAR
ncbi:MAG: DUF2339 domain-containing protein, partial [Alphaproteobacteria bacterium]|nr:DUF2339 domain-containing protein [Alphaproteobacteria bacterium]